MQRIFSLSAAFALLVSSSFISSDAAVSRPQAPTRGAQSAIEKVGSDASSGISEYRLKSNGLQILLAEKRATPIVTVMVVYRVGSRNEAVGYTGSTHFLEHMLFKGTTKHDPLKGTGIDDVLKPIGGVNNATTSYDRTNYFEIVPAEYLAVCLELEADRMRNALLRKSDRDAEMSVVRNELERNDDDPGRLLDVNLFAMGFREHPYHHPVIGWRSDVEGVPIERLRKFYNDFYYPNNATLVVIGDFQTADALKLIEKNFKSIPKSPNEFPKVYTVEPPQEGIRRFTVSRGEDLPKVMTGFHVPNAVDKDTYPLEVAASILGDSGRQSSRLYKALVDKGLASECYAYNYSLRDPGMFTVMVTATPNTASEKLEEVVNSELRKLASEPISAEELEKAKKSIWKRLRISAADPMGMASQLAEAIAVADWRWFLNLENNIKKVTAADVNRVAQKYFVERNQTVGYYYPAKKGTEAKKASSSSVLDLPGFNVVGVGAPQGHPEGGKTKSSGTDEPQPGNVEATEQTQSKTDELKGEDPKPGAPKPASERPELRAPASKLPVKKQSIASQVQKRVLPNGMTVLVMPIKGGVVSITAKIRGGNYFRPKEMSAVPDLVSDMLTAGSAKFTKEELSKRLENLGASLDFGTGNFWINLDTEVVTEDVPTIIPLISDVLQNPLFPEEELAKSKKILDAEIREKMADTGNVAWNAIYSSVYKPGCVFYDPTFEQQLEELKKIDVAALKQYHKSYVTPGNTVIAIVGDIDPEKAFTLIQENLGGWKGPAAVNIQTSDCVIKSWKAEKLEKAMADKTSVDIVLANPAQLSIKNKDFYAASVANSALGHDSLSSRLAELRNKHGLTYGIFSYFTENSFENGLWAVSYTVNPQNVSKASAVVERIVKDYVKNGITEKELREESRRLAGEYVVERMRTPRQIADALTKYEQIGLGPSFMDEYPGRVKAVTRAEVNTAIQKYFHPDKLIRSVAGSLKP